MADLFEIISTRLTGDTAAGGVNEPDNGATAGFHNTRAPEGIGYDRIIIRLVTGIPRHTVTLRAATAKYVQFMVYAVDPVNGGETGTGKAARLKNRLVELFDHQAAAINDESLLSVLLNRELGTDTITDSEGRDVYSDGVIFEIWTT